MLSRLFWQATSVRDFKTFALLFSREDIRFHYKRVPGFSKHFSSIDSMKRDNKQCLLDSPAK